NASRGTSPQMEITPQDILIIEKEVPSEEGWVSKESVEIGICENCGKPIYDGEGYQVWQDNIKTHKECPKKIQ
ncbi:hypothetical protein LCGC14_3088310, partial [marine sediment metagenome]